MQWWQRYVCAERVHCVGGPLAVPASGDVALVVLQRSLDTAGAGQWRYSLSCLANFAVNAHACLRVCDGMIVCNVGVSLRGHPAQVRRFTACRREGAHHLACLCHGSPPWHRHSPAFSSRAPLPVRTPQSHWSREPPLGSGTSTSTGHSRHTFRVSADALPGVMPPTSPQCGAGLPPARFLRRATLRLPEQ